MPPRLHFCPKYGHENVRTQLAHPYLVRYVSRQAITPAPQDKQMKASHPISRYPDTQPPSLKPPEFRRSQLHRQYTSLIRSTPLMLLFQHNNLTASEWAGIRRELNLVLTKLDYGVQGIEEREHLGESVKLQVIKTGIFSAALRVVEYYQPEVAATAISPDDPSVESSIAITRLSRKSSESDLTHSLSRAAHSAVFAERYSHPLVPLLSGPVAILTFPAVSTEYLKAALSVLAPSKPNFPAPPRRTNPGLYEPRVQAAISKLMLLGARVEGSVFDVERTRWVGTISGGITGLRGQLIAALQGTGVALTSGLETASQSLCFTMESRRIMLEENVTDMEKEKV